MAPLPSGGRPSPSSIGPCWYWINLMVAPLPDRPFALVEFVKAAQGADGGFWVRIVPP